MNSRQLEVLKAQVQNEKKVIQLLKRVYQKASQDCEAKIRSLAGRTDMENLQSIIYQKQYQEALKKQLDGILDILQSEEFENIAEYLTTCYEDGFIGTLYDLHGQGIPLLFPIDQTQVVMAVQMDSKISTNLYTRLGEDVDYLKKSIRAELSRGIANGSMWGEMATHIANGMNSPFRKAMNNAMRIARTEGHRIQNQAQMDTITKAKKNGADVVKQWISTLDGRTRPSHIILDGQIREIDDYFEVNGHRAKYPGGFSVASEDIHCRCCMSQRAKWALDQDELNTLKERAAFFGIDKTDDFVDFKNKYLHIPDSADTIKIFNIEDCKTVNEVEVLMKNRGWFNVQVVNGKTYDTNQDISLKGTDLLCAKSIYSVHEKLFEKYPQLIGKLNSITTASLPSNTYAQCSVGFGHGGIMVNTKFYKDAAKIEKSYERDLQSGFSPAGTTWESIVTHEMGHAIDDYLSNIQHAAGMVNAWKTKYVSAAMRPKVMRKAGYKVSDAGTTVSTYAAQDHFEWFAECFAEYMHSDNPRKVAVEFGKMLEEYMKEVK